MVQGPARDPPRDASGPPGASGGGDGDAGRPLQPIAGPHARDQVGEGIIDLAGRWVGFSAHWTEWFDRDLVWGSRAVVGMTIFDTAVLTPVFEETVFRGLLFATLRRRFGVGNAAVLSAAIFAVAHGYGVLGFGAVFWSGLLWAWAD